MSHDPERYLASAREAARRYTFASFAVRQVLPADGWQSVYYEEASGEHLVCPVDALALATRITRDCETKAVVTNGRLPGWSAAEDWEIVALEYSASDCGWTIAEENSNYCGLLRPGEPLQAFVASCTHSQAGMRA